MNDSPTQRLPGDNSPISEQAKAPASVLPLDDPLPEGRRVLIAGYYGWGNTGDEAILTAMLAALRARIPDLAPIIVSGDPDATRRQYGAAAVQWNDLRALNRAVSACELILFGGGGLLQDYWGVDESTILTSAHSGMAFWSAFPLLAALYQKPMMLYALGVGPLTTEIGRRYARLVFEQAQRITVRDADSRALALELGARPEFTALLADPAFAISPTPQQLDDAYTLIHHDLAVSDQGTVLGVALRPWDVGVDQAMWMRETADALDRYWEAHGGSILFFSFQTYQAIEGDLTHDEAVGRAVQALMQHSDYTLIMPAGISPAETAAQLARCDLVLAMRLHAVILAAAVGVPSVGIIYDPKVRLALESLGLGAYGIDVHDFEANALFELLDVSGERLTELRESVRKVAHQFGTQSKLAASAAANLLSEIAAGWGGNFPSRTAFETMRTIMLRNMLNSQIAAESQPIARQEYEATAEATRARLLEAEAQTAAAQARADELDAQAARLQAHLEAIGTQAAALEMDLRESEAQADAEYDALHAQLVAAQRELAITNAVREDNARTIATLAEALARRPETAAPSGSLPVRLARGVYHATAPLPIRLAFRAVRRFILRTPISIARGCYHALVPLNTRLRFRDTRRGVRAVATASNTRDLYQTLVPLAIRLRFKAARARLWPVQNWYVFAFDRFKRARAAVYGISLAGVRVPAEPGLVSIVLPAYNGADMIHEAINSVLAQTYPHFELIVINDGSIDETPQILDEYARRDPRIRVVHQENRKIPRTLSRGFGMARGEFLTWTSCDNRLKPDFLQRMVDSLRRHPDWDMIYADIDIIGDDGAPLQHSEWYSDYQQPPGSEHVFLPTSVGELNLWPNNFIGAAFMYRARAAFLIGDYSRNRYTTEDYDYWMRVNSVMTLRHADFATPIYDYRFHPKSLTAKDRELGITRSRERLMVFEDFRRDFYNSPLLWHIEADGSLAARRAAADLRAQARRAGHWLADSTLYRYEQFPPLWVPVVYVRVTDSAAFTAPPPADLPAHAARILIDVGSAPLPDAIDPVWTTAFTLETRRELPRLAGHYQGWLAASDAGTLFRAIDVRAKQDHLLALENEIEQPTPPALRASIVICTHRYNDRLERAIRAAAAQTLEVPSAEVIVVNNNPANREMPALIDRLRAEAFGGRSDRLRYIVCPWPSLSAARNAGIAAAQGEILWFLDDDSIAEPGALRALLAAYDTHPDAGVIGGHIQLHIPDPRPPALQPGWEKYWSEYLTGFTDYAPVNQWWEFPWGANWSARREALLKVGGFRMGYGRRRDDFGGGEEVVAATLVKRLGYEIGIQPRSLVLHDVDPARFTLDHVRRTLLAGYVVNYREMRDLYIPMRNIILSAAHQILNVHVDPALAPDSQAAKWDRRLRKPVQFRLLWEQLKDLRARLRKPLVDLPLPQDRDS